MRLRSVVLPAVLLAVSLGGARPALATQVKIFQTQSQAGFLAGTLEGVSIDALGRMGLAPRAEKVASLVEPFLLSTAVHPDGWVVGTGNAGKVLQIDRKGKVTELFAAPEPEVFAVLADPDGTVYAATSPRGKVYRIPRGKTGEVYFDPGETYIWSLARAADGALLVATGTQGKLFRVAAGGKGETLYDSDDTHLRSLEVLPGGDVLIGTAGEGLILRLGRDRQVRTLYDAASPEVVALAVAADGSFYAAVAASEASLVDLSKDAAAAKPGEPTVTVTVVEETPATAATGTRQGAAGPRSEILSVSPAGVVESLWTFPEETAYDLLWANDRLWVATGLEGKLYSYRDAQMLLEKDVDERQVVALLPGASGPAFATTNAAAFFRITEGIEKTGTYTSAALDAGQVARFGTFRWRGDEPGASGRGNTRFSFRSGISSEPDRTWSPWTDWRDGENQEVPLDGVPLGRYVQWRTELRADGDKSPRIYGTELSYRQENLKPRIALLAALDAGQVLVPANFNPSSQVFEPAHPNREGIFTSVGGPAEDDGGRTKPLWKKGFRTLRWSAADPNGDQLAYALSFRPAESTGPWLKMAGDLKDDYYSFDATVLPDGVYRFRLVASDQPSNDREDALQAEQVSDPVVVDHTSPVLGKVEKDSDQLRVTVRDSASPLREAVYSLDAEEWKPVEAVDGLLDGRTETLLLEPGKNGALLLLRVTDAAYNVITFDLSKNR